MTVHGSIAAPGGNPATSPSTRWQQARLTARIHARHNNSTHGAGRDDRLAATEAVRHEAEQWHPMIQPSGTIDERITASP